MQIGPVRPRFRIDIPGGMEEAMARVQRAAAAPGSRCVCRVLGHHLDLAVAPAERRRWSPCLQMEFSEEGGRTVVNGLVGPHPSTWTLYAFLNIHVLVLIAFGLVLGVSQMVIEREPWGFWIAPAGVVAMGALYGLSQLGRKLAEEQTRMLMGLVEGAMGEGTGEA